MATLITVYLLRDLDLSRRQESSRWSMEGACVSTIQQVFTVSIVLRSTMTSPGRLQMAKLEPQKNADHVNVMGMLALVILTWTHGWPQGIAVVVSVIIVNTTLKDSTANVASQASTEISEGLSLPQMPANCVPATRLDQPCFLSALIPSVTPAMVTAPANLEWQVLSVTGAWWGIGASESMAADHVTVLEAVTP